MFETVVIATDGSASVERAVDVALDLAGRFDADVHAVYVVDEGELDGAPAAVREAFEAALDERGREALADVEERASRPVTVAVREGHPERELVDYATEHDADVLAMGTRGRHGEHSFLLGSVAEAVVRTSPVPVLTVQLLDDERTEAA